MLRIQSEMKTSVIDGCHGGKGPLECRLVIRGDDLEGGIQFMHDDLLEPGSEIGEHKHEDDEEIYFVVEGNGTMIVDGKESPIGSGDVSVCLSGHSHGIRNSAEAPMRLIVVGARV